MVLDPYHCPMLDAFSLVGPTEQSRIRGLSLQFYPTSKRPLIPCCHLKSKGVLHCHETEKLRIFKVKVDFLARFSLRDALDLGMLGDQFDNTATSFVGFAGLVGYAWSDYACHGPACPSLARIDLIRDEWTLWNVCCTWVTCGRKTLQIKHIHWLCWPCWFFLVRLQMSVIMYHTGCFFRKVPPQKVLSVEDGKSLPKKWKSRVKT